MKIITALFGWLGSNADAERIELDQLRQNLNLPEDTEAEIQSLSEAIAAVSPESTPPVLSLTPTEYVAATAASTAVVASLGNSLAVENVAGGDLSNIVKLVKGVGELATLEVVDDSPSAGDVQVTLATDAGAKATATLANGTVVTLATAGAAGNDWVINVDAAANPSPIGGADVIIPSRTLSSSTNATALNVALATDAGTCAALTLTESSGSGGELEIACKAGWAGAWANTKVTARIALANDISQSLDIAITAGSDACLILITLASDADGDPIAISDDDLETALNAAFTAANLGAVFEATSSSSGDFDTGHAPTAMAGGVDPSVDSDDNLSAAVETKILELAPVLTATGGAGRVTTFEAIDFTGGGVGVAITTDLDALKAELNSVSALVTAGTITGSGATKCVVGEFAMSSGTDAVNGTVCTAGQLAVDPPNAWIALKSSDGTEAPTVWKAL